MHGSARVTAAASLWRTQGPPKELQPAAHRSPETAGRRSPSKHPLAGQGRRAHDLPRVEMLNLGSWTLQGACKSTVAQRTKEGSLESISAAFSIFQTDRRPRKADPTTLGGWDPTPDPGPGASGQCSGALFPPPPDGGPGFRRGQSWQSATGTASGPLQPCPSLTNRVHI